MRMRIYHNLEDNQLEAYVLADEGRALSGQKKGIREALPECIRKINHGLMPKIVKVDPTSRIYVDGYGVIEMGYCIAYRQLRAGSRERLCNTRLARNKFIEFDDGYMDEMKTAVSAVLRNESACRRANGLDTAVRFGFPEESAERVLVAVWEGDSWAEPEPESVETVEVEPVEVEHDGVVDVELAETSETIPVVEAGTAETGTAELDSLSNDDLIEVIANARKVLADRETRAVESEPVLPAECDAVTQEIPEVPPQVNDQARVLQVSEHVIPACVTLREYELTRNVPRKHCKQFRDARGRKCAYVVSADGGAFILWRDWYKHDDAELDAAVRAYYAQVA